MKIKAKDITFLVLVALGTGLFLFNKMRLDSKQDVGQATVKINRAVIRVVIANDDAKRHRGLSGIKEMEKNQGMLFVHEQADRHAYVMRDMEIDLDFLFILDNKIVDIAKNIAKENKNQIKGEVKYDRVLEVNAGWVDSNGVTIGDEVETES